MKKLRKKLTLRSVTVRNLNTDLNTVWGGKRDPLEPRPRTYGCPSRDGVGCLPPKSDGCFTEVDCPTITQ